MFYYLFFAGVLIVSAFAGPSEIFTTEKIDETLTKYEQRAAALPDVLTTRDFAWAAGLTGSHFEKFLYGGGDRPDEQQQQRIEKLKKFYQENIAIQEGHARAVSESLREYRQLVVDGKRHWLYLVASTPKQLVELGDIGTHEAIVEIGSFLEDRLGEKGHGLYPTQPISEARSLAFHAALKFLGMSFKEPPAIPEFYDGKPIQHERRINVYRRHPELLVEPWQQWWREVQSGKRTFSLVGSEQVYGINGLIEPSSKKLPTSRSNSQRSTKVIGGKSVSRDEQKEENSLLLYYVAGAILLISLGIWLRSRFSKYTA